MAVVHPEVVWGRVAMSGPRASVVHAWRRHRGVWLPSLCGRAPAVLDTTALEREEERVEHLTRCPACITTISGL